MFGLDWFTSSIGTNLDKKKDIHMKGCTVYQLVNKGDSQVLQYNVNLIQCNVKHCDEGIEDNPNFVSTNKSKGD